MKNQIRTTVAMLAIMMCATSTLNAQWSLTGNSGTTPGTNYIGTSDSKPLIFKTNGTSTTGERMRINASGNVGIGITTPSTRLHIKSGGTVSLIGSNAGILTIGDTTAKNIVLDTDEIQARNNGSSAIMYLNQLGGNVWIGKDATAASATPVIYCNSSTGNSGIGATPSSDNRLSVIGSTNYTGAVLRSVVNYSNTLHSTYVETKAIVGISTVDDGFGTGVYGEGTWLGVSGYATATGNANRHGVQGVAAGSGSGDHIGLYGEAYGGGTGLKIGVFGTATGGSESYGGYFDTKVFANAIRIGTVGNEAETETAGYKLAVDGKIICEELKVQNSADWPDYVFDDDYKLLSLEEVEQHIENNKHLPGIPSACEVEENGISIGEMQKKLMEKIEELTLYIIELKKENSILRADVNLLKNSH